MTWFNWHAPVITPAQGFVAFLVIVGLHILSHVALKLWRDAGKVQVEPLSDAPGDWPHDGRRG